ncbi:MAG: glycosyltransferase [Treponema sp.]|nr:glycosyltransferase [Treponema sp.]
MIDIILATYNGEKFIETQLLSLMAQSFKEWRCFIHDDGSNDKTVEIVKNICALDSRFFLIEDSVRLKNPGKNFIHTLSYSTSDFVCFCDQDDIWLESKLEKLYASICHKNNEIPQVVFSNAYCWNSEKNVIAGSATLAFPTNIESLLFLNCGIQGASAIFNKKMKETLLVPIEKLVMHDWYLTIAGCSLGQIDYLHENLMLYRQHGNNFTGSTSSSFRTKLKNFLKTNNSLIDENHFESLMSFYEVWGDKLLKNDSRKINAFIASISQSRLKRFLMILQGNWNIYGSRLKLVIKFFMRPYFGGKK